MTPQIDYLNAALPPGPEPAPPERPNWIPVRALAARHRPRLIEHLTALPAGDRVLRFGHLASDAQLTRYVEQLDFERDDVSGIFDRRLQLVAMAHLALPAPADLARHGGGVAEFGVSVAPWLRGRGLGVRLFDHAVLQARNHGIDTLIIHALSENATMLGIARKAGALVERDGADATARLRLPPQDMASQVTAMLSAQAAEFDYGAKRQARRVDGLLVRLGWLTQRSTRADSDGGTGG